MLNIRLFTWFLELANVRAFLNCFYFLTVFNVWFTFSAFLKECVKRRSLASVKVNPYCSEAAAKDAIEAVWDICYNDTRPFDRAP